MILNSYQELLLNSKLAMKELSIIEPVFGKDADEVQAVHHELDYYSQQKTYRAFYDAEDSLPNLWSSKKMAEIKKNFRFSGRSYERNHHFLRAAIQQYRLLNSIRDILPPTLCDTIMRNFSPKFVDEWREEDLLAEEDTVFNISNFNRILVQATYRLFDDYSFQSWRYRVISKKIAETMTFHKQYDLSQMQPVVDAHRYDPKHAFMESKDDSIMILLGKGLSQQAFMLGEHLLKEKKRAFGKKHPIYALALSDMAYLYVRTYYEREQDSDTSYAKAIELQTSAMKLYQKLHMPISCQLSAKFLSYLYYEKSGFNGIRFDSPIDKLRSLIQLKKEELAITQPILGDSAFEIKMAKKELELLNEYIREDYGYKKRHEDPDSLRFQEAVTLYHEGKYSEALSLFSDIHIQEEDRYNYLPIRKNYTRQWEAACYLQFGDTLKAKTLDPYFALGPIDRSMTLELDYLCTFEPSNPGILPLIHETFSTTPMQHVRMLLQTGEIMIGKNQIDCACKCLLLSKSLCKDLLGDNSVVYIRILNTLGDLYTSLNFFQEAAYTFEELLPIEARNDNKSSSQYQTTLNKIINLCEKGNDKKKIMKWQQEKLLTNNSLDVYSRCVLLDSIAGYLAGNTQPDSVSLQKAIDYLKQSVTLLREWSDSICHISSTKFLDDYYLSDNLSLLFKTYAQLAAIYSMQGRTNDIRCLVHESLEWLIKLKIRSYNRADFDDKNSFSTYHQSLWLIYSQLHDYIYSSLSNQYDILGELIGYAKVIKKEYEKYLLFTRGFVYYTSQKYSVYDFIEDFAISREYFKQKNYDGCVQVLQKAIPLIKENYRQPRQAGYKYVVMRYFLPSLDAIGRVEEAASLLREWWQFESDQNLRQLALMNSSQRETFWNEKKSRFERIIPRTALSVHSPQVGSILYDNALLCKGLLLNTEMEIDRIITQYGNHEQSTLYKKLRNGQLQLMDELQKPSSFRSVDTDSLRASLRTLEHELLVSLQEEKSADIVRSLRATWQDVGKNLNKSDIALEFVDVPLGKDSIQYIALVLRKDYDMPHMIPLFTQKDLEALKPVDYYRSPKLYDLLWRPLADELHGIKNIYFSPSASLHQIGIEYLPGMENYSMYRLSSTRELVYKEWTQENQHIDAALYGGLKFELTDTERSIIQNEQTKTPMTYRDTPDLTSLRDLRGAARQMPVLEGSRQEVTAIDSLMRLRHVEVTTATGTTGTEESFKALSGKGKSLLHISTHGFYQPGPKQTDDIIDDGMDGLMDDNTQVQTMEDLSLSRSGLLMTGAADYIFGRMEDYMTDDGILTAREISRMDLKNLDLVVLSACETGLGDISGEGVFGLQRGFKKAGAKTLLVSLWKVEDEATQLLMTEFYRNLLSGQTKRQAFFNAQQKLRQAEGGKFDRYECWAAFVMIDGLK